MPAIRDRIVQEALRMVLEPIYEADFHERSYGFRPNRCTMDAVTFLRNRILAPTSRYYWVIEGDIASYFDTINHRKLLQVLKRRIQDRKLLRLIWQFLRAGVMEGKLFRDTKRGTPQGGIASPALANVYLHELDQYMAQYTGLSLREKRQRRKQGLANFLYVRYGDDVRHITWRQIPFTERRGSEDKTFGSTTYLEAKAEGDSSMSLKRRASEGVYGAALQDPRDTVRATLPKPQFPAMEAYIPCRQRLLAGSPR
jgi:RNA-directed DNA polymerase